MPQTKSILAELPAPETLDLQEIDKNLKSGEINLLCVLGPTASGKTRYAVKLAEELGGEIISADSRQVYRGMDIGTGKDLAEYGGIPYHLIDIRPAGDQYNVHDFQRDFFEAYDGILRRGRIPILCGGTGLYINAVTRSYSFTEKIPLSAPRSSGDCTGGISAGAGEALGTVAARLDSDAVAGGCRAGAGEALGTVAARLDSDAVAGGCRAGAGEVLGTVAARGFVSGWLAEGETGWSAKRGSSEGLASSCRCSCSSTSGTSGTSGRQLRPFYIGTLVDRETRNARIDARLDARLKEGMIQEIQGLLDNGVPAETLISYGLEYKFVTQYVKGELTFDEMREKLAIAIHQFAKRQMTWFRGMERSGAVIHWVELPIS